jgi:hypothetical protein
MRQLQLREQQLLSFSKNIATASATVTATASATLGGVLLGNKNNNNNNNNFHSRGLMWSNTYAPLKNITCERRKLEQIESSALLAQHRSATTSSASSMHRSRQDNETTTGMPTTYSTCKSLSLSHTHIHTQSLTFSLCLYLYVL